jgi:hypothetical protein
MRPADVDRTRALAGRWGTWILPHWMEVQLDPSGPGWEPDSGEGPLRNVAAHDAAPVGTIGAPQVATVDPRGLVTPVAGGWSLDWWVGADDRWHVPAREVAVRQSLLDAAPVVDTAMRVPGGDVAQRVWAFADPGAGPVLAVELRNDGRVPVALALAVRPYGVDGASRVDEITIDARGIVVDGRRAVWFPKAAARVAASSWDDGDVASVVMSGAALDASDVSARCDAGLAQAAAVMPLSHGTSFVVLLPLDPDSVDVGAAAPEVVPPADAVSRGWASHRSRSVRVVHPDTNLAAAFDAALSQVMLAAAGARLDRPGVRDVAAITRALDRMGLREEVDPVIAGLPDGQGQGGRLGGDDPDRAATGAALVAAGRHWSLGRDDALVDALAGQLAAGAHHRPGTGRLVRRAAPLGPIEAAWQLAGSRQVAAALAASGQPDAAAAIDAATGDLVEVVANAATEHAPADMLDLLMLDVVAPTSVDADGIVQRLQMHDRAVVVAQPSGLSPERTARLASVELRRGDRSALDRIQWLIGAAGSDRAWPAVVSPRSGLGCGGAAWSAVAAAAFVDLVADLLCVVDVAARQVRILPVVAQDWLGAGIEAHGLRTPLGVVSFAIRWHGERPAVLWEVEAHDDAEIHVSVPGLDPSWSSDDAKGEALLATPALGDGPMADRGDLVAAAGHENGSASDAADGPTPPAEGISFG